jgi:hypothetical protein
MRKRAPRMRKLTTILLQWSTRVIEGRNRLMVANSGKVLQREMDEFMLLRDPFDAWLLHVDKQVEAHLPDLF